MSAKTTGIVAYLTMIGWLISYFGGDREGAKVHMNQSLVLFLLNIICMLASNLGTWMALLFTLAEFALGILRLIGFGYACIGQNTELPLIGKIHILK